MILFQGCIIDSLVIGDKAHVEIRFADTRIIDVTVLGEDSKDDEE